MAPLRPSVIFHKRILSTSSPSGMSILATDLQAYLVRFTHQHPNMPTEGQLGYLRIRLNRFEAQVHHS